MHYPELGSFEYGLSAVFHQMSICRETSVVLQTFGCFNRLTLLFKMCHVQILCDSSQIFTFILEIINNWMSITKQPNNI